MISVTLSFFFLFLFLFDFWFLLLFAYLRKCAYAHMRIVACNPSSSPGAQGPRTRGAGAQPAQGRRRTMPLGAHGAQEAS